ncbi:MAG: M4 family metallopeptidase [Phycisphaerae bacterium]|nr:M4 family metallopeptidase [Saprospiraceae bacterium]
MRYNADIEVYVDPGQGNAHWTSENRLRFGLNSSDPDDDVTFVSVAGHEFGHGVVESTAELGYQGESGALNESFGDIFGELVEHYTFGTTDWLMGEEIGYFRNLSDPNDRGDPDTYLSEDFWYFGTGDDGGVHTNNGVQNFWFYLLSEGGSGTNDFDEVYSVSGIGIEDAGDIAYLALHYLDEGATYLDAREASLRAARQIFGACSFEEVQVGKAWYAVHVGNALPQFNYEICGVREDGIWQGINAVIGGGSCVTTVQAHADNVTFAAGNTIVFRPGFTATVAGDNRFLAYLESCSFTVRSSNNSIKDSKGHPYEEWLDRNPDLPDEASELLGISITAEPNPFSIATTLSYSLVEPGLVELQIFNATGILIANPVQNQQMEPGIYQHTFEAKNLPDGIYLIVLQKDGLRTAKRVVVAR